MVTFALCLIVYCSTGINFVRWTCWYAERRGITAPTFEGWEWFWLALGWPLSLVVAMIFVIYDDIRINRMLEDARRR